MGERVGLIAGRGRLPVLAAAGIRRAGCEPVVVALAEEADPGIAAEAVRYTEISVTELGRMAAFLREHGVRRLVMAGKVHKAPYFAGVEVDRELLAILAALPRKNDDALLGAVAGYFHSAGLTVLPQDAFLRDLLVPRGVLSRRVPDEREQADIAFGFEMAKRVGELDFGQSVVVKGRAVLAVEAVEGTDETIRRGGRYGHGGAVLVKVSKPQQDPRFDVPTVGPDTIAAMREAGVATLAFEAEKTFLIDRASTLGQADEAGMAVVAVGSDGAYL